MLSSKPIEARDRLIVALDFDDPAQARALVDQLGDSVGFYKLGLQLFMARGYFDLLDELHAKGKKVFADLKFFDVPETVASAVRVLSKQGVAFATVHGNDAILAAACRERRNVGILAVTALTSLDQADLEALGFQCNVEALVLSRAQRALALGCAGVISSGLEAPRLRAEIGERLLIITPGIRPVSNTQTDDQKRTVDVATAFQGGADYIVVGRPIRNAPDPRKAATEIQATITELFGAR